MNALEEQIVELIDEGWARWKIAEQLGLGESKVRRIIRRMCEEYGCTQRELPEKIRREHSD